MKQENLVNYKNNNELFISFFFFFIIIQNKNKNLFIIYVLVSKDTIRLQSMTYQVIVIR